jgi:hypothetical protein
MRSEVETPRRKDVGAHPSLREAWDLLQEVYGMEREAVVVCRGLRRVAYVTAAVRIIGLS